MLLHRIPTDVLLNLLTLAVVLAADYIKLQVFYYHFFLKTNFHQAHGHKVGCRVTFHSVLAKIKNVYVYKWKFYTAEHLTLQYVSGNILTPPKKQQSISLDKIWFSRCRGRVNERTPLYQQSCSLFLVFCSRPHYKHVCYVWSVKTALNSCHKQTVYNINVIKTNNNIYIYNERQSFTFWIVWDCVRVVLRWIKHGLSHHDITIINRMSWL